MLSPPLFVLALGLAAPPEVGSAAEPPNVYVDGETTPPDFRAPRIDASGLRLDGRLEEEAWRSAAIVRGLTRAEPVEGGPGFGRAEFRVFYDADALYVGARVWQPPGVQRAHLAPRDDIGNDDSVNIYLKPIVRGDVAYYLRVNPLGIQRDILVVGPEIAYASWDAVWDSAGTIFDDGYSVEVRIPFASLRLPRDPALTWGFGVGVVTGSSGQIDLWPRFTLDRGLWVSQLGQLRGIEDVRDGHRLEVVPSLMARASGASAPSAGFRWDDREWMSMRQPGRVDPGLDLQYGVTAGLTTSATLNPDFSQVEADANQLDYNLRYPLSLQEKRRFFVEGQNQFETPVVLLYTRSINDPVAGLKVAGQEGAATIGALSAWDQDPPGSRVRLDPSRTSRPTGFEDTTGRDAITSVARFGWDLTGRDRVGIFLADKQLVTRGGGRYAQHELASLDGRFVLGDVNRLTLQAGASRTGLVGGDPLLGAFYLVNVRREDRRLLLEAETAYYGGNFRAETSDLSRVGYLPSHVIAAYKIEEPVPLLAYVRPEVKTTVALDDRTRSDLDWSVRPSFTIQGRENFTLALAYAHGRELYDGSSFAVRSGTAQLDSVVATWLELSLTATVGTRINYDPADLFLGRAVDAGALVRLKPSRLVQLEAQYLKSLFWRSGGTFADDVDVARIRFLYHFNSAWFVRLISQLDSFHGTLSSSALLSYVYRPGTVFYLGYQEGGPAPSRSPAPTQRLVFLKLSYVISP